MADEQIRKVYVKSLKPNDSLNTVFKVTEKAKLTSRQGRPYLAITLVDKTGEIPGRIFENVEGALHAFEPGDYLLVKGQVAQFKGRAQVIVEQIERLSPEPIDAAEFVPPPKAEPVTHQAHPAAPAPAPKGKKNQRTLSLESLLEDPAIRGGFNAFVRHIEALVDARVEARLKDLNRENRDAPVAVVVPASQTALDQKRRGQLPSDLEFKPFATVTNPERLPTHNHGEGI